MKGFDNDTRFPRRYYTPSDILNSDCALDTLETQLLLGEQNHLSQDLSSESELLRTYIEKARLDMWFSWIQSVVSDQVASLNV